MSSSFPLLSCRPESWTGVVCRSRSRTRSRSVSRSRSDLASIASEIESVATESLKAGEEEDESPLLDLGLSGDLTQADLPQVSNSNSSWVVTWQSSPLIILLFVPRGRGIFGSVGGLGCIHTLLLVPYFTTGSIII